MPVTVSDAAHTEATNMLKTINDIKNLFAKLTTSGKTVSDPSNWDGPLAKKFRGEVWPQASKDLTNMGTSLTDLHGQVLKILNNITEAGGGHAG